MPDYKLPYDNSDPLPGTGVTAAMGVMIIDPTTGKPAAAASGSGGPATVADGADGAFGAKADAAATTDTGTFTFLALFKRLLTKTPAIPATGTVNNFGVTLTSQIVLTANAGRLGAVFVNDGPNKAYLLLTTTGPAAANTCTVIIPANGMYTIEKGGYTGNCHMVGDVAGGTFRVTEFTA